MSSRFQDRPKRLARRSERDAFAVAALPICGICLCFGVCFLLAAVTGYLSSGQLLRDMMALGATALTAPVALLLYRVMRGHYSRDLDEP